MEYFTVIQAIASSFRLLRRLIMKDLLDYDFPGDLKTMDVPEMEELAEQIRGFLIEKVAKTGGHLASNLGVVELTLALHKVFDVPDDRILWDVGHQSYVHKILTGRGDRFDSLRQYEGLSGFPKRAESPADVYDAGHSSDSISIALGIAKARDLDRKDFHVVTVIGDGALTGGVAFEALNNAGASRTKMIIIINDNQMSISPNVGGMSQHLSKIRLSPAYVDLKKKLRESLSEKGAMGERVFHGLERLRNRLKSAVMQQSLFEDLGFKFYGPIDGHDIGELTDFLEAVKRIDGPVVLHVMTKKGKGNEYIEKNADRFHGIGPFDPETMEPISKSSYASWSNVFGEKLTEMALKDEAIVAISAAMLDGTGLKRMSKIMPDRVFDVGIAEQHAVSFASGLALQGKRPFVAVYSTFLQRAYDEILMNICMQNLPVVLCIDRAGNVGDDGETHNGQFDLSYLSAMPNMTILAPSSDEELRAMMEYARKMDGPCAIRYPRGTALREGTQPLTPVDGTCQVLKEGGPVWILSAGRCRKTAEDAAEIVSEKGIRCGVINARFIKPLDEEGILRACGQASLLVTLEDNTVRGGFGTMVEDLFAEREERPKILKIGWPDRFIQSGKTGKLEEIYGLDAESVAERILKKI